MREAFDVGHGLNNTGNGKFDPGATSALGQEHAIVEGIFNRLIKRRIQKGQQVLKLDSGPYWRRDDAAMAWGAQRYLSGHCNSAIESDIIPESLRGLARVMRTNGRGE